MAGTSVNPVDPTSVPAPFVEVDGEQPPSISQIRRGVERPGLAGRALDRKHEVAPGSPEAVDEYEVRGPGGGCPGHARRPVAAAVVVAVNARQRAAGAGVDGNLRVVVAAGVAVVNGDVFAGADDLVPDTWGGVRHVADRRAVGRRVRRAARDRGAARQQDGVGAGVIGGLDSRGIHAQAAQCQDEADGRARLQAKDGSIRSRTTAGARPRRCGRKEDRT